MAKGSRKPEKTPFPPWTTLQPGGIERFYERMASSQADSPAMMELSHPAYRVYWEMRRHASPKPDFEFPRSRYERFITRKTFDKTVKELVSAGFIEVVENNAHLRKANKYRFIEGWKVTHAELSTSTTATKKRTKKTE